MKRRDSIPNLWFKLGITLSLLIVFLMLDSGMQISPSAGDIIMYVFFGIMIIGFIVLTILLIHDAMQPNYVAEATLKKVEATLKRIESERSQNE